MAECDCCTFIERTCRHVQKEPTLGLTRQQRLTQLTAVDLNAPTVGPATAKRECASARQPSKARRANGCSAVEDRSLAAFVGDTDVALHKRILLLTQKTTMVKRVASATTRRGMQI